MFSPERVFSGRVFADLETYPKLVGGLSAEGEERGARLYEAFLQAEVWRLGSAEAAELTKLAETTYRDVNIAFANELARFADGAGVDVQRVIDAANSQPFSHIHRPGVAVGGHCIPVYPRFYLHGDPHARLPVVAREVNEAMPAYAVELLAAELGGAERLAGERVLVLGVAYRGDVKETAFSGAFALRDELARRGAQPLAADPLYDDDELRALGFVPWDGAAVAGAVAAGRPRRLPRPRARGPAGRARRRRRAARARPRALRRGGRAAARHRPPVADRSSAAERRETLDERLIADVGWERHPTSMHRRVATEGVREWGLSSSTRSYLACFSSSQEADVPGGRTSAWRRADGWASPSPWATPGSTSSTPTTRRTSGATRTSASATGTTTTPTAAWTMSTGQTRRR